MASEEEKGFTISDRRGTREGGPEAAPAPEDASAAGAGQPSPGEAGQAEQIPEPGFPTILLMLAGEALVHLGAVPSPLSQAVEVNLPAAKHFIDLLAILQEKTAGNLSAEEAGMIEALLTDLRLRYVEATKET